MNFLQMRYLCEIVQRGYNLSEVARALHTSQPGISRHIHLLEQELGFAVLIRQGKRVTGLTHQGKLVLASAKRLMGEFNGLRQLSEDHRDRSAGTLAIATTHFHARYTLLAAILRFRRTHPRASLILHQSTPDDIAKRVENEKADIGFSVLPLDFESELIAIPWLSVNRVLITPRHHPLLTLQQITLQDICRHPLITYDHQLSGGRRVMQAFEERKLRPNVVLTATDADVVKAYVAAGLGVAIVQAPVYEKKRDAALRAVDVSQLFRAGTSMLMMRRQAYVSDLVHDFVKAVAPEIDLFHAVNSHIQTRPPVKRV
ncbi:MAG: LysR family transcriptional regulator [Burkholderiales bacterium]|nr:LysR family transcriptional regulator [Burkholderiales bacterium]